MVVRAREVLISRLLIRCRHQPLSKECRHHCDLTAPSHGATSALHWITGATYEDTGRIYGAILRRVAHTPGSQGPSMCGGREHRGSDIPISGAATDAAGDANVVPPPLLLLNQLPVCQVLGKGHTWAQNGNFQRRKKSPSKNRGAVNKASK